MIKDKGKGHIVAFITILIWGTTFVSTKTLLQNFQPIEILFFRFMIGLAALCIIYPKRLIIQDKKRELYFMFAGICGVTLYYLLENIALTFTLASNVGVICSIAPFFTALLAHIFLKEEKLRKQFFVGFFIAIIGIILITYNGNMVLQLNPIGDFLAIGATIVWAFYSILSKKISEFGYNTIQSTRRIFFYGLLFMIPALILFDFNFNFARFTDPINLLNILFLGLGASALCFVSWNLALRILGAVKTSVYIYLVPVITIISAAIILKEPITWMGILGTIFTLFGLILSEFKLPRRKKENEIPEELESQDSKDSFF